MGTTYHPSTFEDVQAAVRECARLVLRGGGTKPALCTPSGDAEILDLSGLCGVVEYDPGEYTFTALAGTRVATVQTLLAAHGQYLPFDPPMAAQGATLGGTVAAGLSGPGRYHYGGVRDFILGVRFVDGNGQVVRGGGKVVKNSAGFDLPKLMAGSLGQFGALVELTFKVFPQAAAFTTVQQRCPTVEAAVEALYRVYTARLDIDSLDLVPGADGSANVWVRLGGLPAALPARAGHIRALLGGGDVLDGADESPMWNDAREFGWVSPGWSLVKVPITPRRITELEAALASIQAMGRYSGGGNVAWIATSAPVQAFDRLLSSLELPGLVILGPPGLARIGARTGQAFERRVKAVFDPAGRLPSF
ncbi:MAG: FAD-binding protein [Chloroflexi bacterium]|nr:FAD-binding protein [Chloroflexota bacterium]